MAAQLDFLRLTDEQLTAYVGPNSSYYLKHLHKCQESGRLKIGFVWGALLAPPVWLAWRRYYLFLLLYLVVVALAIWLLPDNTSIGTGLSAGMAIAARMIVLSQATSILRKAEGASEEEKLKLLAEKGGVSWIAGGIALTLFLILMALVILAAIYGDPEAAQAGG